MYEFMALGFYHLMNEKLPHGMGTRNQYDENGSSAAHKLETSPFQEASMIKMS